ncbi:hypothetical protein K0M31_017115, partial [Melipona bicolor]
VLLANRETFGKFIDSRNDDDLHLIVASARGQHPREVIGPRSVLPALVSLHSQDKSIPTALQNVHEVSPTPTRPLKDGLFVRS